MPGCVEGGLYYIVGQVPMLMNFFKVMKARRPRVRLVKSSVQRKCTVFHPVISLLLTRKSRFSFIPNRSDVEGLLSNRTMIARGNLFFSLEQARLYPNPNPFSRCSPMVFKCLNRLKFSYILGQFICIGMYIDTTRDAIRVRSLHVITSPWIPMSHFQRNSIVRCRVRKTKSSPNLR